MRIRTKFNLKIFLLIFLLIVLVVGVAGKVEVVSGAEIAVDEANLNDASKWTPDNIDDVLKFDDTKFNLAVQSKPWDFANLWEDSKLSDENRQKLLEKLNEDNKKTLFDNLNDEYFRNKFAQQIAKIENKNIDFKGFENKDMKYLGEGKFGTNTNGKEEILLDLKNPHPSLKEVEFKDGKMTESYGSKIKNFVSHSEGFVNKNGRLVKGEGSNQKDYGNVLYSSGTEGTVEVSFNKDSSVSYKVTGGAAVNLGEDQVQNKPNTEKLIGATDGKTGVTVSVQDGIIKNVEGGNLNYWDAITRGDGKTTQDKYLYARISQQKFNEDPLTLKRGDNSLIINEININGNDITIWPAGVGIKNLITNGKTGIEIINTQGIVAEINGNDIITSIKSSIASQPGQVLDKEGNVRVRINGDEEVVIKNPHLSEAVAKAVNELRTRRAEQPAATKSSCGSQGGCPMPRRVSSCGSQGCSTYSSQDEE